VEVITGWAHADFDGSVADWCSTLSMMTVLLLLRTSTVAGELTALVAVLEATTTGVVPSPVTT
jgi:hypothetical protein